MTEAIFYLPILMLSWVWLVFL